jgi:hypothetical protein
MLQEITMFLTQKNSQKDPHAIPHNGMIFGHSLCILFSNFESFGCD